MDKQLTPEEKEAFFQDIIRKLPAVRDPAKLEELSLLALAMMLRRASSKDLRDELSHQIKEIVASVTPGHSADATNDALRLAAKACIGVLRKAKERRQPREMPPAPPPVARLASHPHGHSEEAKPFGGKRVIPLAVGGAVLLVVIGIALGWSNRSEDGYDPNETTKFVEQMISAAQGGAPTTNIFGGPLEVSSMNGIPVVTARGVPSRVCAASGMRLVKKGLLSVNGETPNRISSAIITELCNKVDGDSTIMWAPTK